MRKILILSANPSDTRRLRLDKEVREIEEGIRLSAYRDEYSVKYSPAVRPKDFRRVLLAEQPAIVHFSGHGEGEDGIVFENEKDTAQRVPTEALSDLFALFSEHVQCVVLNACYSFVQAEAIAQHIDCVIGMPEQVYDKAAVEFATAFYDALGADQPFKIGHPSY